MYTTFRNINQLEQKMMLKHYSVQENQISLLTDSQENPKMHKIHLDLS